MGAEDEMRASIVCGVDGSAESHAALKLAARLSTRLGLRLVVAHVGELAHISYAGAVPFGEVSGRYARSYSAREDVHLREKEAERVLNDVVTTAGLADAKLRIAVGVPAERLADLADEEDAEFIVVGSRGRGAFRSAFLGSVSNSLVGIARCPVLIVPPGATEELQ